MASRIERTEIERTKKVGQRELWDTNIIDKEGDDQKENG